MSAISCDPSMLGQTPHDTVSPSGKVTGVVGKLIVDGEEVHQLHFHIR